MSTNVILLALAVIGTATSLLLFTIAALAEHRTKRPVSTTELANVQSKTAELAPPKAESYSQLLSRFRQEPTSPAVAISFTPINPGASLPPRGRASLQSRLQTLVEQDPLNVFTDERIVLQLALTRGQTS